MDEIKIIKKYYGENLSHLCRELFPSILETNGLLLNLLEKHFNHNKELYNDIVEYELINEFKAYIYGLINFKNKEVVTNLTPQELLDKAGYALYECKTEADIQKFKKYYAKDEELCTFIGGRLNKCYVFFAVKKGAEKLERSSFVNPKREDKYGTSVISIQFTRGRVNALSIKNRYNHHVDNPDATFGNNLDNIIPGLTNSFKKHYKLNLQYQDSKFEIPGYVIAKDGKFYKYNYEINGVYYGSNNVVIDGTNLEKEYLDKSRYLLVDYFVFDMKEKRILFYDDIYDYFQEKYDHFKKITVTKQEYGKQIILEYNDHSVIIRIDKNNCMTSFEDKNIKKIEKHFLVYNQYLKSIDLQNVEYIDDDFIYRNNILGDVNLPNALEIGDFFLRDNWDIKYLSLPKLKKIGSYSLIHNDTLENLYIPKLEEIGKCFLEDGGNLETFNAPNLKFIGSFCLQNNSSIIELSIPNVQEIGDDFLSKNISLISFKAPNVTYIGSNLLEYNEGLIEFYVPKIRAIKNNCLNHNIALKELICLDLIFVGFNFLEKNKVLNKFIAPKLNVMCPGCLFNNKKLTKYEFAPTITFGSNVLYKNHLLKLKLLVNKMKNQKILRKKLD